MDRKPLENLKVVSKPKYDPTINYQWKAEDLFTVSGAEIDAWQQAISVMTSSEEYQKFIVVQRAALVMQQFIKDGVEQEIILPFKPENNGPTESAVPEQ